MLANSPAQSSPKEWAKKTQTTEAECSVVHSTASHPGIRQVTLGLTAIWHHLASDCLGTVLSPFSWDLISYFPHQFVDLINLLGGTQK